MPARSPSLFPLQHALPAHIPHAQMGPVTAPAARGPGRKYYCDANDAVAVAIAEHTDRWCAVAKRASRVAVRSLLQHRRRDCLRCSWRAPASSRTSGNATMFEAAMPVTRCLYAWLRESLVPREGSAVLWRREAGVRLAATGSREQMGTAQRDQPRTL